MIENMDEGEQVAELIEHLTKASAILDVFGFVSWSTWLRSDLSRISKFDVSGLEHLLSAFGGMGSLNDVRLDTGSGSQDSDYNVQLRGHLAEAFQLASVLMPRRT
jgi:hypothetical protein